MGKISRKGTPEQFKALVEQKIQDLSSCDKTNKEEIEGGQDCINCRKDQSYIGRHAPFVAAFVLKTGRHHNIADRQKHTDKIGAKRIINEHT